LKKLLEAKIIYPTRNSTCVSNFAVVRKNTGDFRLCFDFNNLYVTSKKDNYPFPNMEHLLQRITESEMMSFLDGFLGYNKVWVNENDRHKTDFTTPWGNFDYLRIPFGIINARATI
jgi:hypothetical protein